MPISHLYSKGLNYLTNVNIDSDGDTGFYLVR